MNLVAIVGGGQEGRSTDTLVDRAIEGARSVLSDCAVTKVNLLDHDIRFCRNCLTCMKSQTDGPMAECVVRDDMNHLNRYLLDSDCLIFGTPIHMGFASGVMTTFMERICWVFAKPERKYWTVQGCPLPRSSKKRLGIVILTTGIVPPLYRRLCDEATALIRDVARDSLNCRTIGDLYAGQIWKRGAEHYGDKAFRLGEKLAMGQQERGHASSRGAMARRDSRGDKT